MHTNTLLAGVLAVASIVAAQDPAHLVARDDASSSPTPTEKKHRGAHTTAAWESADPSAVCHTLSNLSLRS